LIPSRVTAVARYAFGSAIVVPAWRARVRPTNASCTGSAKGSLYVAGGFGGGGPVENTESFKVSKNKWTKETGMPQGLIWPGSAVYKNVLYCFGGGDQTVQFQGNVYNIVQIYQP